MMKILELAMLIMSTRINNKLIMIMFRPTLKRARLTDLYLENSSTSRFLQSDIEKDQQLYLQSTKTSDLYIPALLTKHNANTSPKLGAEERIITPLKCWDLAYPAEVKQKLGLPVTQVKSRLVGSKFGVYWLITENQLYLWRYQSIENPTTISQHRKFQFQSSLRAIDVGHLDPNSCSFVNMAQHHEIIAIGFEHIIDMYTIDMRTLELKSMDIRFKVQFGQILQTVLITANNQIYYTGDQGYLTRISFNSVGTYGTSKISKSNARPPLLSSKSIWPSLKINAKQSRVFTEKILPTNGNKIYVLIKKQNHGSLFHKMGQSLLKFLSGKLKSSEQSSGIEKQIHVYNITDLNSGTIKFAGVIKNNQIETKVRECYSANQKVSKRLQNTPANYNTSNTISNIYIKGENNDNTRLSVVTNYGIFLTIRDDFDRANQSSNSATFSFEDTPSVLPNEIFERNKKSSSNSVILNPMSAINYKNVKADQDTEQFEPFADKQNFIISSFGSNNLNMLNNGLCFYFDQSQIQFVKLEKYPGFIMENVMKKPLLPTVDDRTWLIFSKTEVTVLRRSELYEYIVATLNTINDLQRIGVENGQRSEQYEFYANFSIAEIIKLAGNVRFSRSLYQILLKIIQQKLSDTSQASKKYAVKISNEMKEVSKEQQKFKIRLLSRLKYQNIISESTHNLFARWFLPKRKQVQLITISITEQIQQALWRHFLVSTLDSNELVPVYRQLGQKNIQNLSPFSNLSIQLFKMCFDSIKNLSITQIRKSPQRIKEVKAYLLSMLGLLEERKIKSRALNYNSLAYTQPRNYLDLKKQDLNNSTQDTINLNRNQSNNVNSIFASGPKSIQTNQLSQNIQGATLMTQSVTQEIFNEISRVIPKLMNTIELYELIASNTQGRYEKLPSIQKFIQSFSARRQVKAALLDLFCMTQIWKNQVILKVSKAFPELNLDADIYVAKWLAFVHRAEKDKQFDTKPSIAAQIKISNIEGLTKKIQIEQILKIKQLFKGNSEIYSIILVNQLKMRKNQLRISKQVLRGKLKEGQVSTSSSLNKTSLIFQEDKQKADIQSRVWLESEIMSLRNQIKAYLQQLSLNVSKSPPAQYLQEQQQLDAAIRVIKQRSDESGDFIKDLIAFLQQSNLIPQKIYQLSTLTSTSKGGLLPSLLLENSKPEFMSSVSLVNNFIKKKQTDIFSIQESSIIPGVQGKVENGESTISM